MSTNPHPVGSQEWAAENMRQYVAADPDPADPTKRRFHGSVKPPALTVPRGKWPDTTPPAGGEVTEMDCPRCAGKGVIAHFYNPRWECPGCYGSGRQEVDPWGRWEESGLFMTTPLRPVRDWGWHLYTVSFWADEAASVAGGEPLARRHLITAEGAAQSEIDEAAWPAGSGWATWEIAESNVEKRLRFVPGRVAGTSVVGAGWVGERA